MSKKSKVAIIGAGFAGLGAGYEITICQGQECTIFEKNNTFGGLCGGFSVDGFHFDKAVHLSFTRDETCRQLFFSLPHEVHQPEAKNYANGLWIRHPVQNNIRALPVDERIRIIEGFAERKNANNVSIKSYHDWLRLQFGEYFSKHYPEVYTRKYWGTNAEKLSTSWCNNRIYQPTLREVLLGSYPDANQSENVYYAKEMHYPKQGGYSRFVKHIADRLSIRYGYEVSGIDTISKTLFFSNGSHYKYDNLISTIPLPELLPMICKENTLLKEAEYLQATSMVLISIGFCKKIQIPSLWFYVYDEDIPFARVNSPSMKSLWNAPMGKSSLQFEVYYSKEFPLNYTDNEISEKVLDSMEKMKIATRDDVEIMDVRHIKYANVIFYHGMEKHRDNVLRYLAKKNICSCGRFGKWDYLWSDQSFLSGMETAKNINII